MLYHHSSVPYAVAAEHCSKVIRERFENQIKEGRAQAIHTIAMLKENQPVDNFIWHTDIAFSVDDGKVYVRNNKKPDDVMVLHRNALSQAMNIAGIPAQYVKKMMADGQETLVENNFNTRFCDLPPLKRGNRPRRFNARSVGSEVRGLVSDAFARWDTNRLVEAFVGAVTQRGGVMVKAVYTDLQFSMKAVWPSLFEPAKGEVLLFGIGIKRSDFGLKQLCLEGVVNRPWCTNLATMESAYTKKNIGVRYDEDIVTQRTLDKQTEAHASAISDLVNRYLSEEFISIQVEAVHTAANTEVESIGSALRAIKPMVSSDESERIKMYYESEENELLPQGETVWRLSNAISLLAQSTEPDRGLELEQLAGKVAGLKQEEASGKEN